MGEPRQCIVSFRDHDGVEHVAEITAESLFEAAALALKQFRRAEWSREACHVVLKTLVVGYCTCVVIGLLLLTISMARP